MEMDNALCKEKYASLLSMCWKNRRIRNLAGIALHPNRSRRSLSTATWIAVDHNPLMRMAEVNGDPEDLRDMPREVQEIAFGKGMIPHIPDHRE
jgi:hypothetical protein